MTLSLESLVIQQTEAEILEVALVIAESIGLPVSSWQPGDPTRSVYLLEAQILEALETVVVNFIKSGFLEYSAGTPWLKVNAQQGFNVDVPDATFATTSIVLTNAGGGVYDAEPFDLTFKSTISGKTYHNTTAGHLNAGAGQTLTLTVEADEAGSDSSAGAGEIDSMVTVWIGVTCSNPTAALGLDEQDAATTVAQCHDKLGSLSPNGPKEANSYVARNPELTGTTACTRARAYADSETGDVVLYCAGPSGAIAEPDRVLVEAAIVKWATPLCTTPTVLSAADVVVPVTYSIWVYKSVNKTADEIEVDVLAALEAMIKTREIGGDIIPPATTGTLYKELIQGTIRGTYPQAFRVDVSSPAADVPLTNGQVAALGTVTATIFLVVDP